MIGCGVFVTGTGLGIAWYWFTAKGPLEKDRIWFIVKMFGAIVGFFILLDAFIELFWG